MTVATAFLFMVFGQERGGTVNEYSAVFSDVSDLKSGDSVRFAGIRIGTVRSVSLQQNTDVIVSFDADRDVALTQGTRLAVRYLNLVGDRYLEIVDEPGSTRLLPAGSQIPKQRTVPALDLDLLLGGLKPVIRGLNPQDVNALTASLLDIFQDQGASTASLMARVASFSNTLADNGQTVQAVIERLRDGLSTVAARGDEFSATLDRMQRLVTELTNQKDPIADAIDALDHGTATVADLLNTARPPLAGTVNELSRLAPILDGQKDRLQTAIQKAPENYRKLIRIGSYGSFVNYYICGVSVRVTDLQGRTAVFPWFQQDTGRCTEP
ncbi:MCE family protein [Mycobacterium sp. EPa45]|uniref:MCE family protein n=1 Tax=Mycobacterium sp. EPa45 TaxID=1545728 RepID=UPI001F48678E|nr:MCE family protein [Mycobacterium sp. EPa45]